MTENEIIKALECCITNDCVKCKAYDETNGEIGDCLHAICRNALDLIKRQKAEIERLKNSFDAQASLIEKKNLAYDRICVKHRNQINTAKSEAIKELLNVLELRVVCKQKTTAMGYESAIIDIKNLLKEMVGDDNA